MYPERVHLECESLKHFHKKQVEEIFIFLIVYSEALTILAKCAHVYSPIHTFTDTRYVCSAFLTKKGGQDIGGQDYFLHILT